MKRKLLAVLVTVFVFLTVLTVSASATTQDGWVVVDGYYHYYEDGYHYADGEYWFEDYDSYFRFDEEGRMLSDTWYDNKLEGCWQYYKAGGYRAENEILNIGGYLYAFDYYSMVEGYAEFFDESVEEWRYVYATDGGVLYTGWIQDEDGYWYYYLPEGYMARNQVAKVGDFWYAFNWSGQMYTEASDVYDYEIGAWRYFRPNSDGTLITGWYKDEYGDWYYYGENGLAPAYGLTYVGSVPYFFWGDGQMATDCTMYDEEGGCSYYIDDNGYVSVLNKDGWTLVGSDWYYCENGAYVWNELKLVGNTYYYFDYDGIMETNTTRNIYFEELGYSINIRIKANGAVCVNEWYQSPYGYWYYYGEYGEAASGITLVGETLYAFEHNGQMLTDEIYYGGDYTYYVNNAGVATALNYNGWTSVISDSEEKFVYCVDGEYLYDQMAEINGAAYYFDGYFMATNSTCRTYNPCAEEYSYVRAGASGALLCGEWYKEPDGDFMYFGYDYAAAEAEIVVINDTEYLFGYNSRLVESGCVDVYVPDYGYVYYVADDNGVVVRTPGWYCTGGNFYYINEDGSLYEGDLKQGDKIYNMWPEMQYAYVSYHHDENGVWLYCTLPDGSLQWISADGLYTDDYATYYVEGGKLYYGWKQIDGNWHYFDPGMYVNGVYSVYDENTGEQTYHYFDAQGKMLSNCWIKDYDHYYGGTYFYADEYGYLVEDGIVLLGNTYYYFNNLSLRTNTTAYYDDNMYIVDGNGVATLVSVTDGWVLAGNNWYYLDDGYLVRNDYWYIDDYCYGFDYNGKMIVNGTLWDDYYFDANGHRYEGWLLEDGKWTYYTPYKAYNGAYEIDGLTYYFEDGYLAYNKTFDDIDDNVRYVVGADGTVVSETPLGDGWFYQYGGLYYRVNGDLYEGWYGNNFFEYGRMVMNDYINYADNNYYFDARGNLVRGWYEAYEDSWIYADANGVLKKDEWAFIGNNWYYFDGRWMLSDGVYYIDAEEVYAEFDKNGVFVGYVNYNNDDLVYGTPGWNLNSEGKWTYFNSAGARVENSELYIGNSWYLFKENGEMAANEFSDGKYYTASGARLMATSEWKLINNEWCYFGANGEVVSGWVNINGNDYYIRQYYKLFDKKGNVTEDFENAVSAEIHYAMVTGYYLIDWEVYYFDNSGVCHGEYTGNGWVQLASGRFVYFQDGEMLEYGAYNIGGKMYAFIQGYLVTNEDYEFTGYYADKNGVLYGTGWHKTKEGWIYVQDDYSACYEGVYNIGGAIYYFHNGYMI